MKNLRRLLSSHQVDWRNKNSKEIEMALYQKKYKGHPNPPAPADLFKADDGEMCRIHILKTWPEQWAAVYDERKTFELRLKDRDFMIGDYLILARFEPTGQTGPDGKSLGKFSQSFIITKVTQILEAWEGLHAGYCIMSIKRLDRRLYPDMLPGYAMGKIVELSKDLGG